MFPAKLLASAKHSAVLTNHLTDTNNTQCNLKHERALKNTKPWNNQQKDYYHNINLVQNLVSHLAVTSIQPILQLLMPAQDYLAYIYTKYQTNQLSELLIYSNIWLPTSDSLSSAVTMKYISKKYNIQVASY